MPVSIHALISIYAKIIFMIDDVFAVIADSTRRQILRALTNGSRPVGELVDELGISQPTVSKHLKVLRNAGLVESEAVGQKRFYSLTPEPLDEVTQWISDLKGISEPAPQQNLAAPIPEPDQQAVVINQPEPPVPPAPPAPEPTSSQPSTGDEEVAAQDRLSQVETSVGAHFAPADEATITDDVTSETDEETTDSAEDDAQGFFTLGEEGEIHQHAQPRHAHRALNFTPLEPFQPEMSQSESSDPTTSIDVSSIPLLPAEEAETHLDVVVVEEDIDFDTEEHVPDTASSLVDDEFETPHETSEAASDIELSEPAADREDQEEVADTAIPEETNFDTEKNLDAEKFVASGADVPSGYVAYTGEPDSTEFIDDVPSEDNSEEYKVSEISAAEESPAENTDPVTETTSTSLTEQTETQVVLENADPGHPAEQDGSDDEHESRGFLASLTRWGRRRSR